MAACLWQANPQATSMEIARVLRLAGHLNQNPDVYLGYGIPDMHIADRLLRRSVVTDNSVQRHWTVFPNPFSKVITLFSNAGYQGQVDLAVYDLQGVPTATLQSSFSSGYLRTDMLSRLPAGLYILKISTGNTSEVLRIIKTH
jgi:serine protease AprX